MSIAAKLNLVGRMHDHGVRAVSGTDGGIGAGKPHGITAHALGHMIEAGVPNAVVLGGQIATTALPTDRRE